MQVDIYHVRPDATFSIAVGLGCNLFRWTTGGREVLWSPEGFGGKPDDFFKGGNPILFPSVGRTWDRSQDPPVFERYRIFGKATPFTMPIHGILPSCSWTRIREAIREEQVQVEYSCAIPAEVREKHYPFDMELRIRYTLQKDTVRIEAAIENRDCVPAPFAFGFHPYFAFSDKSNLQVHLPCRSRMVLDPKLLISLGTEPMASGDFRLEPGKTYDNGFTDVSGRRASISDTNTGRSLHIDVDENIQTFVICANPQLPFVCIEPWTDGLGGYETLRTAGWETRTEMPVLRPGETKRLAVAYHVE